MFIFVSVFVFVVLCLPLSIISRIQLRAAKEPSFVPLSGPFLCFLSNKIFTSCREGCNCHDLSTRQLGQDLCVGSSNPSNYRAPIPRLIMPPRRRPRPRPTRLMRARRPANYVPNAREWKRLTRDEQEEAVDQAWLDRSKTWLDFENNFVGVKVLGTGSYGITGCVIGVP